MATVALSAFFPEVLPSVEGCADIVALNAVRNTIIDFCTRTLVWAETQDAFSLVATDLPKGIDAPTGGTLAIIQSVKINGRKIDPTTMDYLDATFPDWENTTGEPRYYFMPNPDELDFYPRPDVAVTVRLRAAYTASRSASSVERFLHENYLEVIAAGALSRLLAIPLQPWVNLELAAYYKAMYESAVFSAMSDVTKSLLRVSSRVQISNF